MKPKITISLLFFSFLIPSLVFAQEWQRNNYFVETDKSSSPKILPTEVQNAYDVKWYFLNLNAENNTVELSGDVTIKAQVVWDKMDTFSFHLHRDYTIDRILINGTEYPVINQEDERLVINLGIPKNTLFDAQIFYHGTYSGTGGFLNAGITTEKDTRWGDFNVTWTLSEANNAFHWFPVKQNLTDKADSSWVFVTTTKPNMVASNGLLKNVVDLPNNKVRYEWKSSYPIDYYLIFIAVAQYQDYTIYATIPQTGKQMPIQNYIYNSAQCLSENKTSMDATKDMIEYYSEIFGEYPFSREKYGHALSRMGGAMEHQTMTTTGYLYDDIVAHELVHQWFGDNVTCASWQHIWLNEGFARYGELLWNEHKLGKITAFSNYKSNIINSVINNGKTGSVFVPIGDIDNENRIFNGTLSYNKASTLLHMIRYLLEDNDDLFFNVLQTYQNRFKDHVATSEDFKNVLEEISGMDFTTFFDQWLYGQGYPMFNIKWNQLDEMLNINSVQTTTAPNITPLFKVTYELKINYEDNTSEVIPFYHDETTKQFTYIIPDHKTVKSINFDPNNWILATAVFAPNSVEDFNNDKFITAYPNPTTGELRITSYKLQITNVEVFDIYGKNVFSHSPLISHSSFLINISHLNSGVYFLSVCSGDKVFVTKIVKK